MKNDEMLALRELFLEQLQDIYDAETQLVESLPMMISAASSPDLADAFEEHLDVTQMQVERLDQIFSLLGEQPVAKTCRVMEGLLDEGEEMIDNTDEDSLVRDCGLISTAQKVEHYEIAAYGSLRSMAEILKLEEVADLIQVTLDEEKEADEKMTELVVGYISEEAEDE